MDIYIYGKNEFELAKVDEKILKTRDGELEKMECICKEESALANKIIVTKGRFS